MIKNEKDKQTTAHMTQHRKLKNKQHEPHQKTRGDLRCSGRVSRSSPHVVKTFTKLYHMYNVQGHHS